MARADNAGHKAKRRNENSRHRTAILLPILLIAAILAIVAALGFGSSSEVSKEQVRQEVAELLDSIPQDGAILGSPEARITVWVYADLECPTVKLFVENYLPLFVDNWVQTGVVKIAYRSLETDTTNERVFFEQEVAALAAGRQDRMWDFLLTFARQQGEPRTDYAGEEFIAGIGTQVPSLSMRRWHRDREDAALTARVALGVRAARAHGFRSTPSFLIEFDGQGDGADDSVDWAAMKQEVEDTLQRNLTALQEETREDFPTLKVLQPYVKKG
jgi:protein-disulfide isomerase